MYRIDNWINEGSGWIVESIDGEYVNISAYSPLAWSTNFIITYILNTLTDSYLIKLKIKIKGIFAGAVYNALVVTKI